MEKFDVVVIGGGPGGYPAAIRAAQLGASVALVEKEYLGGTCLNWGCIPTKTLIASSDLYAKMKHAAALGIKPGRATFDYATMIDRKNDVVGKLRNGVAGLLKANGVTVLEGTGSFLSAHRIAVCKGKSETVIEAGKVIIATGSNSSVPGFLPKSRNVVESRAFLELKELPASLLVLGGGVIGCEFACMAAQLGSKVTIVELLDDILLILDKDVRRELRRRMESELGIKILTGKALEDVKADKDGVSGKFDGRELKADMLLVSIGRRPETSALDLDKAGISTNKAGYIEVDDTCATSVATIFAIGDVNGGPQLAHAATAQGVTAAEHACKAGKGKAEQLVPGCIFTSPEIGTAGIGEDEAREKGLNVKIGKFSFIGLGKALASGETDGFVKWIVDAETDQLIGAQAIGAHATELISEAAAAIRNELTAAELGKTVHCHPTMSESWMEAAHAVHGECIHAAPRRR